MDDGTLRERYRRVLEGTRAGGDPVPLETIEALAEGRLEGPGKLEVLDRVLADPAARAEFEFLREIVAARPRSASRGRVWLIAAALLVAVGGGLVWRASSSSPATSPEPLRGTQQVVLMAPRAGGTLLLGGALAWRPVAGAVGYVVEVLTADGAVAFHATTSDTTAAFAGPEASAVAPGMAVWLVAAQLSGGDERRSVPRRVVIGR